MAQDSSSRTAAWSATDLAGDPHRAADKARRVRSMFGAIAPSYDLNNRLHSFFLDQSWRRRTARLAEAGPGTRVLDVACGTGDLAEAFAARGATVTGVDFTEEMLTIARSKAAARPALAERLEYRHGDAMALPVDDASVEVVSIAFGLRNVADPARAVAEFARVLVPGGRLVILEFSRPRNRLLAAMNDLYCTRIMPWTATLLSGDRSGAYHYLPRSIETFATPADLARMTAAAGLVLQRQVPLTFGVCTVTVARRPASAATG